MKLRLIAENEYEGLADADEFAKNEEAVCHICGNAFDTYPDEDHQCWFCEQPVCSQCEVEPPPVMWKSEEFRDKVFCSRPCALKALQREKPSGGAAYTIYPTPTDRWRDDPDFQNRGPELPLGPWGES
jgi:hypothetical protein